MNQLGTIDSDDESDPYGLPWDFVWDYMLQGDEEVEPTEERKAWFRQRWNERAAEQEEERDDDISEAYSEKYPEPQAQGRKVCALSPGMVAFLARRRGKITSGNVEDTVDAESRETEREMSVLEHMLSTAEEEEKVETREPQQTREQRVLRPFPRMFRRRRSRRQTRRHGSHLEAIDEESHIEDEDEPIMDGAEEPKVEEGQLSSSMSIISSLFGQSSQQETSSTSAETKRSASSSFRRLGFGGNERSVKDERGESVSALDSFLFGASEFEDEDSNGKSTKEVGTEKLSLESKKGDRSLSRVKSSIALKVHEPLAGPDREVRSYQDRHMKSILRGKPRYIPKKNRPTQFSRQTSEISVYSKRTVEGEEEMFPSFLCGAEDYLFESDAESDAVDDIRDEILEDHRVKPPAAQRARSTPPTKAGRGHQTQTVRSMYPNGQAVECSKQITTVPPRFRKSFTTEPRKSNGLLGRQKKGTYTKKTTNEDTNTFFSSFLGMNKEEPQEDRDDTGGQRVWGRRRSAGVAEPIVAESSWTARDRDFLWGPDHDDDASSRFSGRGLSHDELSAYDLDPSDDESELSLHAHSDLSSVASRMSRGSVLSMGAR